jgi:hypothetical protein
VGTLRSEPLEASKLGRPGRLPVRAGGGNQSPRPRSDLPDNPNPGAEERAEHFTTPLARHGAVDGGKWIRVAQLLAEEDALELSQEARALGGKVRKAMNPHGNMNGAVLYEEERSLIEELRNAGHGDLLSEPLGMLEEALDSLEAGEPHPSDQNHEDDPEE